MKQWLIPIGIEWFDADKLDKAIAIENNRKKAKL